MHNTQEMIVIINVLLVYIYYAMFLMVPLDYTFAASMPPNHNSL